MKKLLGFTLVVLLTVSVFSQTSGKRNYFAVGLFASAHSSLITYAMVTFRDGAFAGAVIMSEARFMYEAMGYYPSIANLNKENLFEKYGVDSCFLLKNDLNKISGYYCKPFLELWKIRFFTHPSVYDSDGWSQGQYKPSRWQREYLYKEYGVTNVLLDYFYGDSLFKILRDVQSPDWIYNYHFMTPDTTDSANK